MSNDSQDDPSLTAPDFNSPEHNRLLREKHNHPMRLGKHRGFFKTLGEEEWELSQACLTEQQRADTDGGVKPMITNRQLCASRGYGVNSVWPPFDPGSCRNDFESEMARHGNLVGQRWLKLNRLVLGSEKTIQDTILKLSQGKIKDDKGKTLDIDHYLNLSWEKARDTYNNNHATESGEMTSSFRLDPKGGITPNRSADLDVFSLVYLTSQIAENLTGDPEADRNYPLYRNGANYMEDRQLFQDALLNDEKFQRMRKPGPNNKGKVKFNNKVEEFLEKHRASFLVPHINALDLTNTLNLLTFIHNRARFLPREFVYQDYEGMYLGSCTHILAGACDPTTSVYFKKFTDKKESGFPVKPIVVYAHREWPANAEREEELTRRGILLPGMGGWLTLQSQAITYLFLTSFCQQMLHLAKMEPVVDPVKNLTDSQILAIELAAAQTIEKARGDKYAENLDEIEALRQYELAYGGTEFFRYSNIISQQSEEAAQNIRILFDDPDYFARKVIEEKEHHWENLRVGYDEVKPGPYIQKYYDDDRVRHALYLDCMRAVLRRAFFDFFIWDAIAECLKNLVVMEAHTFAKAPQIEYVGGGKSIIALGDVEAERESTYDYYPFNAMIQMFVRQAAAFYVYEFRKKAIHAASAPMRDTYCIPNADKKPKGLPKGYYDVPDIELNFRHQASPEERSQVPRMVLELIENFISSPSSCMFVGTRKTAARILRYFEECEDDKKTSEKFSGLIRDTVKSLSIISEIADQMAHFLPNGFYTLKWGDDFETRFIDNFADTLRRCDSYDLPSLNGCSFTTQHVPDKRLARIFSFLDEVQGIGTRNENSYGTARGDIKRFGSSLLKGLIYPLARKEEKNLDYEHRVGAGFVVKNEALERLTLHMQIKKDHWPFHPDEKAWNTLSDASQDEHNHYQGIWKDLKESMKELSKQNRKKLKKPWSKSSKSSNMYDFVADEVKLARAMADISKRQTNDCVKKRRAKKKALDLRRRNQEEAVKRALEAEDAVMQDAPDENVAPDTALPPEDENDAEDIQDPAQGMEIDADITLEPEPEPEAEQPQVLVPPQAVPTEKLNKSCWDFWDSVFSDDPKFVPKVTFSQFTNALDKIGFQQNPQSTRGSSHFTYGYKPGVEHLPGVTSLNVVKPHSGTGNNASVARYIVKHWRHYLEQRGLTLEKLEQRFCRP
ncbi:hypothetical protein FLONG3_1675 [Fusarium longipes]|uniref:Uncharacterized protein n=1 Tax=Fusarium longipes TaxID=694270 RepID=A0A395T646_9HYPO|nr:hypothetical protein FLONG3_1675 [Fusarium longipes]